MNDINVKKINIDNKKLITIAALLVNAAKIDEQYTNKEKEIILSFIIYKYITSVNISKISVKYQ